MSDEPDFPKLNFSIVQCTGEDESFPVSQLVRHATSSQRGWHSMKLCEYPQEIILRFNGDVHLKMIRILAHETKIPSRIDLSVCRPENRDGDNGTFPPIHSAVFHRLGYLNFTNNEASGFESRELKTASLNTRAVYLKLSLRRCHANMSNVFNQVGVVAVGCYGEIVHEYAPVSDADSYAEHLPGSVRDSLQLRLRGATAHEGSSAIDTSMQQAAADGVAAAAASGSGSGSGSSGGQHTLVGTELDPQVVHKMEELNAKKNKAVTAENYDEAKRLKIQIDRLRDCGQTLADLEERKRRVIEAEDYDVAKALKMQIDDMRETVMQELENAGQALLGSVQPQQQQQQTASSHGRPSAAEEPHKSLQQQFDDQPVGGGAAGHHHHERPPPPAREHHAAPSASPAPAPPPPPHAEPEPEEDRLHDFHQQQQQEAQEEEPQARGSSFDEKPAVAGADASDLAKSGGIVVAHHSAKEQASSDAKAEEIPTDWEKALVAMINSETSSDIPSPDPLGKQAPATQAGLIQSFGRYITSCLSSRRFQHREAAVRVLTSDAGVQVLEKRGGKSPVACVASIMEYLGEKGHGVDDGIPQAFFAACDSIKTLLTGGITGVSAADVASSVAGLIPQLLLKAGDSNQRVREHASATLVLVAMASAIGPERVAAALLHDPQTDSKRQLNFRVQLARLSLATVLLAKVGLSTRAKPTGLSADGLTKQLCIPQLTHSSGEVREAAVHLIVALYGLVPNKHMDTLLAEVKPAQRSLIDEQLAAGGQDSNTTDAAAAALGGSKDQDGMASSNVEELKSTSISVGMNPAANSAIAAARAAAVVEEKNAEAAAAAPPTRALPGAKGQRESPMNSAARGKKAVSTPRGKAAPGKDPASKGKAPPPPPAAKAATKSPAPKPAGKKQTPAPSPKKEAPLQHPAPVVAAAPPPPPAPAPASPPMPEGDEDHSCQFCGRYDPRYTEEALDRHYLRSCPLLCACPLCGQISEIALLQEHLTSECTKKSLVRPCPNCHEAIRAQDLDQHIADASCVRHNPTVYNVCPLCHAKTGPFEQGWKDHFAKEPGCPNNPRQYDGGNIEDDFQE